MRWMTWSWALLLVGVSVAACGSVAVPCDPGPCTGGGGTGGGGSGKVCGGLSGGTCPSDEFCYFGSNTCGDDDETGVCKTRPTVCSFEATPDICGCDGIAYGSECEANAHGTDIRGTGFGCTPPGSFVCGSVVCSIATDYCEMTTSDTPPMTTTYACKPLPPACQATQDCSCVAGVACGNSCIQAADGSLTVTCFGG